MTTRRTFLRAGLGGVALSVSGCSALSSGESSGSDGDGDEEAAEAEDGTSAATETTTPSPLPDTIGGEFRQFQHDAANTGHVTDWSGPRGEATERWVFREASLGPAYSVSTPAVADGTLYVAEGGERDDGTVLGVVHAIDAATGESVWRHEFGETNSFGGTAVADGTVLQPIGGSLVGFDAATGEQLWEVSEDLDTGVTSADGTAYVIGRGYSGPPTLYAVSVADGSTAWTAEVTGGPLGVPQAPAIVDGRVYVGGGNLYVLSADDGSEQWETAVEGGVTSQPTVVGDTVYVTGDDRTVRALSTSDGTQQWAQSVPTGAAGGGGGVEAPLSPAVAGEQLFVMQSWQLTALATADGARQWSRDIPPSNPPVTDGETVYVSGVDVVGALDAATGDGLWAARTDASSGGNRSVAVCDGVLYLPSAGVRAYA